jgi:hypothetical protein
MREHDLKTWPRDFEAIVDGLKTHDIRATRDRRFAVGDVLHLREWSQLTNVYTGRAVRVRVTYVSQGPDWGLPPELCVMSISLMRETPPPDDGCEGC